MPVYLLHGFRWPRTSIRIHIILQNLDDAAAEWLVAPATTSTMLENFNEIYPDCMKSLPALRFVEQYDPADTTSSAASQPYAYVADVCVEVKLGVDVDEIRGKGVPNDQWAAIMELRDKLAADQKVAWYVVVCGDEDRWAPALSESDESVAQEGSTGASRNGEESSDYAPSVDGHADAVADQLSKPKEIRAKGLRKLFSSLGLRKSRSVLSVPQASEAPPPPSLDMQTGPQAGTQSLKTRSSHSSGQKAITQAPQPRSSPATSMPNSTLAGRGALHVDSTTMGAPGAISLSNTEEHEVITGPQSDDDDDLAAPAPIVRHGKQQDQMLQQRKRKSISSLTAAKRPPPAEELRHTTPLTSMPREAFTASATAREPQSPPATRSLRAGRVKEMTELDDQHPAMDHPASYVPSGAPSLRVPSRSSSPAMPPVREPTHPSMPLVDDASGVGPDHLQSRSARTRRSANMTNVMPNGRQSQFPLSSMSGAMAQLYAPHDRAMKNRQSVTQDELAARGLDDMDFTALR